MDTSRARRPWTRIPLFLLLGLSAAAQVPTPAPSPTPVPAPGPESAPADPADPAGAPPPVATPAVAEACAKLRAGNWSVEAFENLVADLLEEKCFSAVEWWARSAEEAVAAGRLPPRGGRAVAEARLKLKQQDLAGKEARELWPEIATHVRDLLEKKAPEEAAAGLKLAEDLVQACPEAAWKHEIAGLRQRVGSGPRSKPDAALEKGERETTAKLSARLRAALKSREDRALSEFRRYGCTPGYVVLEALIRARGTVSAYDGDLKILRESARGFGIGGELVLRIMGKAKIRLHQDGEPVLLEGAGKSGFFDGQDPAERKLRVLPGEIVGFDAVLPEDGPYWLGKDGKDIKYGEFFVRATLDGRDLPKSAWQSTSLDQIRRPWPKTGGFLAAAIGPDKTITIAGKSPNVMNYDSGKVRPKPDPAEPNAPRPGDDEWDILADYLNKGLTSPKRLAHTPDHESIETRAGGRNAASFWITSLRENAVYILTVPLPPKPAK